MHWYDNEDPAFYTPVGVWSFHYDFFGRFVVVILLFPYIPGLCKLSLLSTHPWGLLAKLGKNFEGCFSGGFEGENRFSKFAFKQQVTRFRVMGEIPLIYWSVLSISSSHRQASVMGQKKPSISWGNPRCITKLVMCRTQWGVRHRTRPYLCITHQPEHQCKAAPINTCHRKQVADSINGCKGGNQNKQNLFKNTVNITRLIC